MPPGLSRRARRPRPSTSRAAWSACRIPSTASAPRAPAGAAGRTSSSELAAAASTTSRPGTRGCRSATANPRGRRVRRCATGCPAWPRPTPTRVMEVGVAYTILPGPFDDRRRAARALPRRTLITGRASYLVRGSDAAGQAGQRLRGNAASGRASSRRRRERRASRPRRPADERAVDGEPATGGAADDVRERADVDRLPAACTRTARPRAPRRSSRRLRDPRTIVSIVLPIVVLVLVAVGAAGLPARPAASTHPRRQPVVAAGGLRHLLPRLPAARLSLVAAAARHRLRASASRDSTEIIFISWLVNCLVPAKLGDVYRAWLLRVNYDTSRSADLRDGLHRAHLRPLRHRDARPGGGLLELPRRPRRPAVQLHPRARPRGRRRARRRAVHVRNFGRRIIIRLPLPHRVVEFYERFEEGVFALDRRARCPGSPS